MTTNIHSLNLTTASEETLKSAIFDYGTANGQTGSYSGCGRALRANKSEKDCVRLIAINEQLLVTAKFVYPSMNSSLKRLLLILEKLQKAASKADKPAASKPAANPAPAKAKVNAKTLTLEEQMAAIQAQIAQRDAKASEPQPEFPELSALIAADIKGLRAMSKAALLPAKGSATALRQALFAAMS